MFPDLEQLTETNRQALTAHSPAQCFDCHSYGGPDKIPLMNKCINPPEDTVWDLGRVNYIVSILKN